MTNAFKQLEQMLITVAQALGKDLLRDVAFVGGCTTGLLVTDDVTREAVRFTEDVDLIVDVLGYPGWAQFQNELASRGFSQNKDDDVICRMRLGSLKVDFMPDDEAVLGFGNRWYKQALEQAQNRTLSNGTVIRILTSPFFVATKLEAYKGRGNDDPLTSHDLEDIICVVDGRSEITKEISNTQHEVSDYISREIGVLLDHESMQYAVEGSVFGDSARAETVFRRLESIKELSD